MLALVETPELEPEEMQELVPEATLEQVDLHLHENNRRKILISNKIEIFIMFKVKLFSFKQNLQITCTFFYLFH